MSNYFRGYVWQEVKLQLKRNVVWSILAISLVPVIFISFLQTDHSKLCTTYTQILLYLFPILSAIYFSEDFSQKTSRIIYFNQMSKLNILIVKIVTYLLIGSLFSFVRVILSSVDQLIDSETIRGIDLGEVFLSEILFILLVGSIACLVSIITYQKMASIVIVLLIFVLEPNIRALLYMGLSTEHSLLKMILDHFPISIMSEILTYHTLNTHKFFLIIGVSLFIYGCSAILLEKKESV